MNKKQKSSIKQNLIFPLKSTIVDTADNSEDAWIIVTFKDKSGFSSFKKWAGSLEQKVKALVLLRLDRIRAGNLGDFKSLKGGLYELRFRSVD